MVRSNADAVAEYRLLHPAEPRMNAEIIAQMYRSNAEAIAEFRRIHPTKKGLEWAGNVMRNWRPPESWPAASNRNQIFENCAKVLRSAIDTNQIELAFSKLPNRPGAVTTLMENTNIATSNLDEFASLLTRPELKSYVGAGYCGDITTSSNIFHFRFGTNYLVNSIEKRTLDDLHVVVGARFNENGKLFAFSLQEPDKEGILRTKMQLDFNEDGGLRSYYGGLHGYWMRPADKKP
jgi:hypothetical protein